LSPEEKKILYAKLRERMRRQVLEVSKCPQGRTPYWARKQDRNEMSRLDVLGFKPVVDDPESPLWGANGRKEDGTFQLGDLILMEIDSDSYDYYLQDNIERSDALVRAAKEDFRAEASKQGVPTFTVKK
jgi:hypothetical protein